MREPVRTREQQHVGNDLAAAGGFARDRFQDLEALRPSSLSFAGALYRRSSTFEYVTTLASGLLISWATTAASLPREAMRSTRTICSWAWRNSAVFSSTLRSRVWAHSTSSALARCSSWAILFTEPPR